MSNAQKARDIVEQMPDVPIKTLARRLRRLYPERFKSIEHARKTINEVTGRRKRLNCKQAKTTPPKRKAGQRRKLPTSRALPWTAVTINGPARVASFSDAHIPFHNESLEACIKHAKKKHKPTDIIINGDWGDYYSISRWQKNPELRNLPAEIDEIIESLEWLREMFPDANIKYKAGNHCERWDHFIWERAPDLWGIEKLRLWSILELDRLGITYVDRKRPIMAGRLPVFHGHELPRGMTNPVNQARGMFLRMTDSALAAHGHTISTHTNENWNKERSITCWSQACLCDLHPEYMPINKWSNGYAFVEVFGDNSFEVFNYRRFNNGMIRQS